MIGRRGFISSMIGAMVLDPDRMLWVPGAKTISIPNPLNGVDITVLNVNNHAIWLGWFNAEAYLRGEYEDRQDASHYRLGCGIRGEG